MAAAPGLIEGLKAALKEPVHVNVVPAGLAIGTEYFANDGDGIGFYIVGPGARGKYVIESDTLTLLRLESAHSGGVMDPDTAEFTAVLNEHAVNFDRSEGLLCMSACDAEEVPARAALFLRCLLRLHGIASADVA